MFNWHYLALGAASAMPADTNVKELTRRDKILGFLGALVIFSGELAFIAVFVMMGFAAIKLLFALKGISFP
jgi:hypothetical protein